MAIARIRFTLNSERLEKEVNCKWNFDGERFCQELEEEGATDIDFRYLAGYFKGEKVWSGSVAIIKHFSREKQQMVRIGGSGGRFDFSYDCLNGGGSVCSADHVIQIVDNVEAWYNSDIWKVAEFYRNWSLQELTLCTECKKEFLFSGELICNNCKEPYEDQKLQRSVEEHKKKRFSPIELSDEQINEYNAKCIFNRFKRIFENNTKNIKESYCSKDLPEYLIEHANKINKYKKILSDSQVQELREIFKRCYGKAVYYAKIKGV